MQLQCVGCRQDLVLGAAHCPACRRPVDADGNGLPDALDQRIKAAAQQAVADERAQVQAQQTKETQARKRRLDEARLQDNLATPRTWTALALRRARDTFLMMLFVMAVLGMPMRMILASAGVGLSGPLWCLAQCADCSAPGRAFAWNYRGSCQENKGRMGYAYVCTNPRVDVSTLNWTDVRSTPLNDILQPYMVHGGLTLLGDVLLGSALVALARALFGTSARLRALDEERAELERKLSSSAQG